MQKLLILLMTLIFAGCSAVTGEKPTIALPLLEGWFEAQKVYYITTDVSDPVMARQMQANYAPRLRDAVPDYPKPPTQKTVLERVYTFPTGQQASSVFASVPSPLGHGSQDKHYSPLWLIYTVEWRVKDQEIELRSEAEIFKAEAQGWVQIERTPVVVNCPVVSIDGTQFLPTP
ncbi:DUF7482 domain-containing protein [Pontibacter sp. JAM-7]|uniref:DUF7482 domain-containing protein n=1 Tax=Pontibacter sp. JAM-7 TaxID=3366581 RepID=UPI003AF6BB2F